jgi:transposase IS200/IS605 family
LNVVNKDIAVKTANFIVKLANEFKVDVIVMEHRDLTGRKRGTKRQRLHHWRAKYV